MRVEVPDIVPHVATAYIRHRAGKAIIESGGTQKAVAQLARRHRMPNGAMMNVVEYNPKGRDKLDRATDMLNLASVGRLWLPQSDPTFPLAEVECELLRFTGDPKQGGHDDIVDTASMAGEEITRGTGQIFYNFTGKYGMARPGAPPLPCVTAASIVSIRVGRVFGPVIPRFYGIFVVLAAHRIEYAHLGY